MKTLYLLVVRECYNVIRLLVKECEGIMTFETIKRNYDRKLWNKSMVGLAVKKNVITAEQYQEIVGEAYVA